MTTTTSTTSAATTAISVSKQTSFANEIQGLWKPYLMRLCYVYSPTDRCSYHAYKHSETSIVQVNSQKLSWFWPLFLSVYHTQISAFYLKSIKWIFFSSDYIVSFRIVLYIRNMVWLIRLIEFCFRLPHK